MSDLVRHAPTLWLIAEAVDNCGHWTGSGKPILFPPRRHKAQCRAIHDHLHRLVFPLEWRAGVYDRATHDVAGAARKTWIQRRGATTIDNLNTALGVKTRRHCPPDLGPVFYINVVIDHDDALQRVVPR